MFGLMRRGRRVTEVQNPHSHRISSAVLSATQPPLQTNVYGDFSELAELNSLVLALSWHSMPSCHPQPEELVDEWTEPSRSAVIAATLVACKRPNLEAGRDGEEARCGD